MAMVIMSFADTRITLVMHRLNFFNTLEVYIRSRAEFVGSIQAMANLIQTILEEGLTKEGYFTHCGYNE